MSRRGIFVRIAVVLAGLALLVVVAALVLLHSERFAQWALATAADRIEAVRRVDAVSGSFSGGLEIGVVEVGLDAGNAVATSVSLNLDLRSLLDRALVLDRLHIGRVEFVAAPAQGPADEAAIAESPVAIWIRDLRVDELLVSMDAEQYEIRDVLLELRLAGNRLQFSGVEATWQELAIDADAVLTLAAAIGVESRVCIDGVLFDESSLGCVEAVGSFDDLQLEAEFSQPFAVAGSGTLQLAEDDALDLSLSWQDAAVAAVPDIASPQGSARVSGALLQPRIESSGVVVYQDQVADFALEAVVEPDAVRVDDLRLTQDQQSAQLSGVIASTFDAGEFSIALRNVDPQRINPQWSGFVDATADVTLSIQPELTATLSDVVASGELLGYPLAGIGAFEYAQGELAIEMLQVDSNEDRISVTGRVADDLDLVVVATVADLGIASPDFSGALNADLRIAGSPSQPSVDGQARLANFSFGQIEIGELLLTGSAGLAAGDQLDLVMDASNVRVAGTVLGTVRANASGMADSHVLEVSMLADAWSSQFVVAGGLDGADWQGSVDEFVFVPNDDRRWALRSPATARYGQSGAALSALCLVHDSSNVCVDVAMAGTADDRVSFTAQDFDLGILAPFLPSSLRVSGRMNASGELLDLAGAPRGSVDLTAADGRLDVLLADGVEMPVPVERFELAARFDATAATLSARLGAGDSGSAAAALIVTSPLEEDGQMRGSISLQWHDASALELLSPDIDAVRGRLNGIVQIGGTLAAPALNGSLDWLDGALEVPAWGLVIDQIEASIDASESREAVFTARGLVESTPVSIDGSVLLDPEQGWPMQLALRAEDLPLVQNADAEIHVSPDLNIDIRLPDVAVTGSVIVPYARIRETGLPVQAVVPSADTTVHGLVEDERGRPLNVSATLVVELGDDVTWQGSNLEASATGRLDLEYRSGEGAIAQGALTLTGQYDAYGNPLSLDRGRLIFVGPLEDPSLDILAVRRFSEVTAGVAVTGTLRAPVTNVFSDPVMSEADALSWLLFGRPLDGTRAGESDALRSAALSMGLQQALPMISRIGETLRLDDFAIRNTDTDAGSLMAGKYLSPNLYFRYTYGLFNRIGGLLLRYRINDRFSLETRSGENNSMDLLYTVEKD